MGLRHIGDTTCNLGPREVVEQLAFQKHSSSPRRNKPQLGLEERRLAGAVGAEQAEHRARPGRQRYSRPDLVAGIADRQVLCFDRHAHARRPRASSQRKNGAPTTAVRMPSGTSAPEIVRASVSTASM